MDRDSWTACPKHGNLGEPRCPKCWEALCKIAKFGDALIVSEDGDMVNE